MTRRTLAIGMGALLLIGGGLGAFGCQTRAEGRRRLEAAIARHAAGPGPTTLAAFAETLPEVDEDRQARLWAWLQHEPLDPGRSGGLPGGEWLLEGEPVPFEELAWAGRLRPRMDRLEEILADGPVELGVAGWLRQDAARLDAPLDDDLPTMRCARLTVVAEAIRCLVLEALRAEDSRPALDRLDAFCAGALHPRTMEDWILAQLAMRNRDDAWMRLALSGRLSSDLLARWLSEPPPSMEWAADSVRLDLVRLWLPGARAILAGRPITGGTQSLGAVAEGVDAWIHGMGEFAAALDALVEFERQARGERDMGAGSPVPADADADSFPWSMVVHIARNRPRAAIDLRMAHRAARLGMAIAVRAEREGECPATDEEAHELIGSHAALARAGPQDLRIRYRRLAPDAFQVGVDPESPVPDRFPPGTTARSLFPDLDALLPSTPGRPAIVGATFAYRLKR